MHGEHSLQLPACYKCITTLFANNDKQRMFSVEDWAQYRAQVVSFFLMLSWHCLSPFPVGCMSKMHMGHVAKRLLCSTERKACRFAVRSHEFNFWNPFNHDDLVHFFRSYRQRPVDFDFPLFIFVCNGAIVCAFEGQSWQLNYRPVQNWTTGADHTTQSAITNADRNLRNTFLWVQP